MVAMAVGDEDMADPLAACRLGDGRKMGRVGGSGIDHGDLARADNICVGAEKGVGAGIVGHDAPHVGRDRFGHAVIDVHATIES